MQMFWGQVSLLSFALTWRSDHIWTVFFQFSAKITHLKQNSLKRYSRINELFINCQTGCSWSVYVCIYLRYILVQTLSWNILWSQSLGCKQYIGVNRKYLFHFMSNTWCHEKKENGKDRHAQTNSQRCLLKALYMAESVSRSRDLF